MNEPRRRGDAELGEINKITERIIGCAIEVHRCLGPGLLEPMYQMAMCIELEDARLRYISQLPIPAFYKGRLLGEYRVDLVIEDLVLVEIKSVERMHPVFDAQLMTYLRLMQRKVGLMLNFNSRVLREGIKRVIL